MWKIQDRETGTTIEECATYEEAKAILTEYEETDRQEGAYTENFYEIKMMKTRKMIEIENGLKNTMFENLKNYNAINYNYRHVSSDWIKADETKIKEYIENVFDFANDRILDFKFDLSDHKYKKELKRLSEYDPDVALGYWCNECQEGHLEGRVCPKKLHYVIVYEDELMKSEEESTYERSGDEEEEFETLEEAQKRFAEFESKLWVDGNIVKTLYKTIATLYVVDENGNREMLDTK